MLRSNVAKELVHITGKSFWSRMPGFIGLPQFQDGLFKWVYQEERKSFESTGSRFVRHTGIEGPKRPLAGRKALLKQGGISLFGW